MSRRSGSLGGGFDIWVSYREHVHDDLAWQPPTNAGALVGINTNAFEQNPFFLDNDEIGIPQLFFTRGVPSDLYVSSPLPDGTFGPPTPVAGLNSSANERGISVRFDGLEAVLMSTRAGGSGAQDLWSSTRNSVFDPWSAPVNLGALINSSGGDFDPFLAADRESLYFMSNRNAAVSGQDIFVATRVKQKPH
jgi:hypothetical protein